MILKMITSKNLSNFSHFNNNSLFKLSNIFQFKRLLSSTTKDTTNNSKEQNVGEIDESSLVLTINSMTVKIKRIV